MRKFTALGFTPKPRGYWQDIENRKKFFVDFARDNGFDPYDPECWRGVTDAQIVARQVENVIRVLEVFKYFKYFREEECCINIEDYGERYLKP